MTASAATPPAAPAVGLRALLDLAEEARLAGDYRSGSDLARRAFALAQSSGDATGQADALHMLASQLLRLGEYEEAIIACRDAVALLEYTAGDRSVACNVLTVEALALTELGMHEEALEVLSRARQIAHDLADRDLLYWVHNRTGVVHGNMGNHRLSAEYLLRALGMVDGMGDEARFCILNNVGDNAVHRVAELLADGDTTGAEAMLRASTDHVAEALRLARAASHPYRESICLDNFGMLLALAGDHAGAERMIGDALAIAARHGYPSLESSAMQHRAQVRMMRGDCATAITELCEALGRVLEAGEMPVAMEIHRELSAAYEQVGDPASALRHYREYHRLERAAHNELSAARARMAQHHFELDNARLEADNARLETELHRLRTVELEAEKAALQQQATEDPLTGLANRRNAELWLAAVAGAARPLGVAMIDVDLFKTVNDRFGHLVGDRVLQQIARTLRAHVRESDLVARIGGEEFLVGVDGLSLTDATARCELLRAGVASFDWESLQPGLAVTISIGLAMVAPGGDLAAATALADQRLYAAKRQGRNCVVFEPPT
jgi:diguanylate cyclase (GGDEF)-like protein